MYDKRLGSTGLELPVYTREELEYRFAKTGEVIARLIEKSMPSPKKPIEKPEFIVRLILGDYIASISALERSLVTRLGMSLFKIVEPWFHYCKSFGSTNKGTIWDGRCYRDGKEYVLKTILSIKMNSTQKKRIESESHRYDNPIVLAMSGKLEDHYLKLGKAYFLDGYYTWYWLTGHTKGYSMFLSLLREKSRPLRKAILDRFFEELRKKREGRR